MIVAHSMGGLVARTACLMRRGLARNGLCAWNILCSWGRRTTAHRSSVPASGVDVLLGATPYSAPFATLAQLRSAGITDLRHGRVAESGDGTVALPAGVACHAVAATLAGSRGLLADRLVGDGLVPLRSALGRHDDPARSLAFAKPSEWIAYRTGHMELLSSDAVGRQIVRWLGGRKL